MADTTPIPLGTARLDVVTLNDRVVYLVDGVRTVSVQFDTQDGSWPTGGVVSLTFSNDAENWSQHANGAITFNAEALSKHVALPGAKYAKLEVTTAGSGTAPTYAQVVPCGRRW